MADIQLFKSRKDTFKCKVHAYFIIELKQKL